MKNILIVGGNSSVGKSLREKLPIENCKIYYTGTSLSENEGYFKVDLSSDTDIINCVSNLPEIDGLVLTAGIIDQVPLKFIKRETLIHFFNINFFGQLLFVSQLLKSKKINKGASVVVVSSIAGNKFGSVGNTIYASTKAAFEGAIKCMVMETAKQQIRINSIQPGMLKTDMWSADKSAQISSKELAKDEERYPFGYGLPNDVASVIQFLLSEDSKYINGASIVLDGGFSIQY
jgi:NAD(P)-dependent dehydrogenase (short-subunit alcohol dehydrogenase family)